MSRTLLRTNVVLGAIAGVLLCHPAHAASTQRISISNTEVQGNAASSLGGDSVRRVISANGRFVAFVSVATNLVAGDTNSRSDVFVRDRVSGATERISVSSAELQGNQDSRDPSISADGRYVAFISDATNLVFGDTNNVSDVFFRDRQTGLTYRVSLNSAEVQANARSQIPSISADGWFIAFQSDASNLVAGDSNGFGDVFVRNRRAGTTVRVSLSSAEIQGNAPSRFASISGDGRYVAFSSTAINLVGGDTNNAEDIFVRDRTLGTTQRVSVNSAEALGIGSSRNPFISDNGRFVAFSSSAPNLVGGDSNTTGDVFVRDRTAGTTQRVSLSSLGAQGSGSSGDPAISADGRYVVFRSVAANLVSGDTNAAADIFLRDRQTGITSRVSLKNNGTQAAGSSSAPSVSGTGRFVAFRYLSNDLIAGDTNTVGDVYLRDRGP